MDDTEIHFVGDDTPNHPLEKGDPKSFCSTFEKVEKKSMKEIIAEKKRMMDEKKSLTADEIQKKRNDEEKKKNDEIEEQKSKQLKFEKVKQMLAIAQKTQKHLEYKSQKKECKICGRLVSLQHFSRHKLSKIHTDALKLYKME